MQALLPVAEALTRILASAAPGTAALSLALAQCEGLTLAKTCFATRDQPPFPASAMDGYAACAADIAGAPAPLRLIGESAAGRSFSGTITQGTCVRIFTGAPVPMGADVVILQEDVSVSCDTILVSAPVQPGRHIRPIGVDFTHGEALLPAGMRLDARKLALAAAMNHATLPVRAKPRVGIIATGDELVLPGTEPGLDQIIASNNFAIAALARAAGAEVFDLGIAADTLASLEAAIKRGSALELDLLVTSGGASVGDHDLVQAALKNEGLSLDFWRIAMRPGKPMMFGERTPGTGPRLRILGLPGNPVASYVCGLLFMVPLLRALQGDPEAGADRSQPALLGCDVAANDKRQDYLRSSLAASHTGLPIVTPFPVQDSSMLGVLAKSDALLIRAPFAPPAKAGDICRVIRI